MLFCPFRETPFCLTLTTLLVLSRLPYGWLWSSLHEKQVWLHGFWQFAEGGSVQPAKVVTSRVASAVCRKEGLCIPHSCFSLLWWWDETTRSSTLCHRVCKNKSIDLYHYKWIYWKWSLHEHSCSRAAKGHLILGEPVEPENMVHGVWCTLLL